MSTVKLVNTLFTITFLSLLTVLPSVSVTSYTTLYVPNLDVFTVLLLIITFEVKFPSSVSDEVTPNLASNLSPKLIFTSDVLILGFVLVVALISSFLIFIFSIPELFI